MNISLLRNGACLLMFLSLGWLTVCLPYVARAKKAYAQTRERSDDSTNPLTNTTEEKNPQVNLNEEYLHHEEASFRPDLLSASCWYHHPADRLPVHTLEYFSPPPDKC